MISINYVFTGGAMVSLEYAREETVEYLQSVCASQKHAGYWAQWKLNSQPVSHWTASSPNLSSLTVCQISPSQQRLSLPVSELNSLNRENNSSVWLTCKEHLGTGDSVLNCDSLDGRKFSHFFNY